MASINHFNIQAFDHSDIQGFYKCSWLCSCQMQKKFTEHLPSSCSHGISGDAMMTKTHSVSFESGGCSRKAESNKMLRFDTTQSNIK